MKERHDSVLRMKKTEMQLFSALQSSTTSSFFFFLLALFPVCSMPLIQGETPLDPNNKVPALFAFGDSLHDTGNNNVIPTIVKSDFPPYGRDFKGQEATGRFSNGKISPDLFASSLGLKELLPPYLHPDLKPEDLLTGVSFASAGTGYDILTAKTLSVLTLRDQIAMFKEYIERLIKLAGEEKARSIISDSLYIVSGGSNDLVVTYFDLAIRRQHYDVPAYVDFLIHTASDFLKELYELGARKIGVVGLAPLGCIPIQRSLKGGFHRNCPAASNQASIMFNSKLLMELQTLSSELQHSRIGYLNVYDPTNEIILYPSKYGFEESTKGCCATGTFELAVLCNDLSPYTCANTSKYFFWDSVHPTQRVIEIVVSKFFENDLPHIL